MSGRWLYDSDVGDWVVVTSQYITYLEELRVIERKILATTQTELASVQVEGD